MMEEPTQIRIDEYMGIRYERHEAVHVVRFKGADPEDENAVGRFEEKHISSFWDQLCKAPDRLKYGFDFVKPRFEIFTGDLQPNGLTENYMTASPKA